MKVISFVNMKGGVAKTTLAVNIADCLASRHDLRVLVIDIDPQFNATQCLIDGEDYKHNVENGCHTIVDIFNDAPRTTVCSVTGSETCEPLAIEDIEPWEVKDNFDLVAGALELYRLDMSGGQGREHRLKNYVEYLGESDKYDVVIIDTPPTPSAWMSAALIASNYYLVPVKPEPLSATGIDLLRSVIDRVKGNYGLRIECAGLVFTIAEEATIVFTSAKDFINKNKYWQGKLFNKHLPKRTAIARNQGVQRLILESDDAALKMALTQIASELIKRIGIE